MGTELLVTVVTWPRDHLECRQMEVNATLLCPLRLCYTAGFGNTQQMQYFSAILCQCDRFLHFSTNGACLCNAHPIRHVSAMRLFLQCAPNAMTAACQRDRFLDNVTHVSEMLGNATSFCNTMPMRHVPVNETGFCNVRQYDRVSLSMRHDLQTM